MQPHRWALSLVSLLVLPCVLSAQSATRPAHPRLDPTRYELAVTVSPAAESLFADARITLVNRQRVPISEAGFLLYRMMRVHAARSANGRPLHFAQRVESFDDFPQMQVNYLTVPLSAPLRPGDSTIIDLQYSGFLRGYAETGELYVQDRIDTTYTLLRMDANAYPLVGYPSDSVNRSFALPNYDYELRVTAPNAYTVANLGALVRRTIDGDHTTWVYRNIKPAWRIDIGVARFGTLGDSALRVFYLPGDSAGAARVLAGAQRGMALFTRWFGPLDGTPHFAVLEVPDGWGSQADVSGIIQAAAAFRDTTRSNELYHEVSHLWNPHNTERPAPRIEEGLATFLEYLAKDSLEKPGIADSTSERYATWVRRRVAADSQLRRVPMVDYGKRGMTDYSYSVGMLMFSGLHRLVGQAAFDRIIGRYYAEYHRSTGSVNDLVAVAEHESPVNLAPFFNDWLFTTRWTDRLAADSTFATAISRYH